MPVLEEVTAALLALCSTVAGRAADSAPGDHAPAVPGQRSHADKTADTARTPP
ncbi:hypothetical protein ACI780_06795 [Geodermatophilus sp. SYSU D00814]